MSPLELGQLDHVAVVVPDIDEAKCFYTEALGMTINREGYNDELGVAMAFFRPVAGGTMIEAIELRGAQRDRLVANRTPGLDHVAVQVRDVDEAAATLTAAGVEWTTDVFDLGGRRSVFSRPETSGGVVYQLVAA